MAATTTKTLVIPRMWAKWGYKGTKIKEERTMREMPDSEVYSAKEKGSSLSHQQRREQQKKEEMLSPPGGVEAEGGAVGAGGVDAVSNEASDGSGRFLRAEDVAQHNQSDDCWIIINNKVYDVTEFGKTHPGGPVIFTQAGRDATDYFRVFHSAQAWAYLPKCYVGDLQQQESDAREKQLQEAPELLSEYRELRRVMQRGRLFESSKLYYGYKTVSNLAILAASLWIIGSWHSLPALLCSAFLMGLFWQQCGWLSHDYLHHQVMEDRWLNTIVGGLIWGNFVQGYSVSWWKTKHNVHHAATNECDKKFQPVDPDIDTIPLLAWSKEILATVDDEFYRSIIKVQHILFVPLLFLARFSWLHSSWEHVSHCEMSRGMRFLERSFLVLHHLTITSLALWLLPLPMALGWLVLCQLFCGFLLSIVFVISHNGMDVHNDSARDFVTAQVSTTRNIEGGVFNDWFTGGLNRQIEHHLFPSLPRQSLKTAAPFVKALCQKHGLLYEELSLWMGICRAFTRLVEVAHAV